MARCVSRSNRNQTQVLQIGIRVNRLLHNATVFDCRVKYKDIIILSLYFSNLSHCWQFIGLSSLSYNINYKNFTFSLCLSYLPTVFIFKPIFHTQIWSYNFNKSDPSHSIKFFISNPIGQFKSNL